MKARRAFIPLQKIFRKNKKMLLTNKNHRDSITRLPLKIGMATILSMVTNESAAKP
jgi:hypothetical protein